MLLFLIKQLIGGLFRVTPAHVRLQRADARRPYLLAMPLSY